MIQQEHFTTGRCNSTFGRTIRKSLKVSPVVLLSALLPSVLHKSRHASLVICTQPLAAGSSLDYRYGRTARVFDYSAVESRHTAEGPSQMWTRDLQQRRLGTRRRAVSVGQHRKSKVGGGRVRRRGGEGLPSNI